MADDVTNPTVEQGASSRFATASEPQGDEAGGIATSPIEPVEGQQSIDSASVPVNQMSCSDCDEFAEFVTLTEPPVIKCFRCAILKAMERPCGLCGSHPTECLVRAIGENERRDVIGVCADCFSKRLS